MAHSASSTRVLLQLAHDSSDLESVRAGGDQLSEWSRLVLHDCVSANGALAYGGVLIPQVGIGAGKPCRPYGILAGSRSNQLIDPRALSRALDRFTSDDAAFESMIVPMGEDDGHQLIVRSVSHVFDRPIGVLWAVAEPAHCEPVIGGLDLAVVLVSLSVHHEKTTRALDLLSRISWKVSDPRRAAAKSVVKGSVEALSAVAGIVWEVDKENLRVVAAAGDARGLAVDMPVGKGVAGACVVGHESWVIDDLLDDRELAKRNCKIENKDQVEAKGWHSAIFAPLAVNDRVCGVIAVYGRRPRAFSETDRGIAEAFAERLNTVYVQSARVGELQERDRRLQSAASVVETGMSALDNIHDMNNLLIHVQNDLRKIRKLTSDDDKRAAFDAATAATNKVALASALLNETVNSARITQLSITKNLVWKVVDQAIEPMRDSATSAGVRIENRCPKDVSFHVDKLKLRRVLVNLIDNALYFLARDRLTEEKLIVVDARRSVDEVILIVRDNGPGIHPEAIDHVFDFLYSTKIGEEGSGLGLPIAKLIIESHGGTISVESIRNECTEFTIRLPGSRSDVRAIDWSH